MRLIQVPSALAAILCCGFFLAFATPAQAATTPATITIVGTGAVATDNRDTCAASCVVNAQAVADVTFSANQMNQTSVFDHWSGDCSGTAPTCHLDMRKPHSLTATFRAIATHLLTIARPVGAQVYSSDDGGQTIQCGSNFNSGQGYTLCSKSLPVGTVINLAFIVDTGRAGFTWSQDCASAGTAAKCAVTMSADHTVSGASAVAATNNATITIAGGGWINANYGMTCTNSCVATINAIPDAIFQGISPINPGIVFDHWGGDCSGTANPCHLDMRAAHSLTAFFKPAPTQTLTIVRPYGGQIYSVDDGGQLLQCGSNYNSGQGYTKCSTTTTPGKVINLAFIADASNTSYAWTRDCASAPANGRCTVTMSADHTVSAGTFAAAALTVTGAGAILVDGGQKCTKSCTDTLSSANPNVLTTASTAPNSVFDHWSGDCTGTAASCTLAMNAPHAVTAVFRVTFYTLSLGTTADLFVTSPASTVTCSAKESASNGCSIKIAPGAVVMLRARGSVAKWTGCVVDTSGTCNVTMDGDKYVEVTAVPVKATTPAPSVFSTPSHGVRF